jgi:hypothetical protein
MEVDMSWLEADGAMPQKGPPPLRGAAARRETLQVRAEWLEREETSASGGERRSRRPPAKKSPPPLPDTPKAKRPLPPPIPREERASEPPARRSTRPPKTGKAR